jgi:hypothetical protein
VALGSGVEVAVKLGAGVAVGVAQADSMQTRKSRYKVDLGMIVSPQFGLN